MYSAMKIKANNPLLYSILNPDTSSDSPSAKSKGVRLVSAKFVMNQRVVMRGISNRNQDFWLREISRMSSLFRVSIAVIKIRDILTS